jgi:ubiquinone/menaquinone biosynthesis C-methylase UbiE
VTANGGIVPAFDAQAAGYDARTGFPPGVGEAVADAIVRMAGVGAQDLVLELGAGTGEIGVYLAAQVPRYLGLDTSPAMLDAFRAKAAPRTPHLLVADGDASWPVPDASACVIFASRVIHLLRPDHVAHEATRVCAPRGYVMLGRVTREPDSLKERLRRRRQQELREVGIQPRSGEAGSRKVLEHLVASGWADLGRESVAAWSGDISAGEVIAEWESLTRMGSVEVDSVARKRILSKIRTWAAQEFGSLERVWPFREQYVLDIVQLPERRTA